MLQRPILRGLVAVAVLFGCGESVRHERGSVPAGAGAGGSPSAGGAGGTSGNATGHAGVAGSHVTSEGGSAGHADTGGRAGVGGIGDGGGGGALAGGVGGATGHGGSGGGGTGENAGAAGATEEGGAAGAAGAAGACALSVPSDFATIQDAIAAAEPPAVVCVEPGLYGGSVVLRDGVSLRGTGDNVFVCGDIQAANLEQGVSLERIGTGQSLRITTPARLRLLGFIRNGFDNCGVVQYPAIPITLSGGKLELDIDQSSFSPNGLAFDSPSAAGPVDVHVTVRNSRCLDTQCYDFVQFGGTLAEGSRVDMSLENNVLANVVLEGVGGSFKMTAADLAGSSLRIVHNTFFNPDEPNEGIYLTAFAPGFLEVDNNAIASFRHPIKVGDSQPGFRIENNVSGFDTAPADRWYDTWFVDADHGDFHPAPSSPLIGAGDDTLGGVLEDADGASRVGRSDIGAYQAESP